MYLIDHFLSFYVYGRPHATSSRPFYVYGRPYATSSRPFYVYGRPYAFPTVLCVWKAARYGSRPFYVYGRPYVRVLLCVWKAARYEFPTVLCVWKAVRRVPDRFMCMEGRTTSSRPFYVYGRPYATPVLVLNTDTSFRSWPCLSSQQARPSQPLTPWQPELRLQYSSRWLPTWKTLGSVTQCGSLATGVSSRPAYVPIMICWRYYFYLLISLKF